MFDADTTALIAQAPELEGLDLTAFPQRLTEAYATIVTARVRLRKLAEGEPLPEDIEHLAKEMKRVAFTNEAFVSAGPDRENRAAAAFVAGAAHHVSLMASRMQSTQERTTRLAFDSIAPEVSATLLFLIAEATADAAEMSKAIVVSSADPIERHLLETIVHLSRGDLTSIVRHQLPNIDSLPGRGLSAQGVSGLFFLLSKGVHKLAEELLGLTQVSADAETAVELFKSTMNLCVEQIQVSAQEQRSAAFNLFPGPHHLASLLHLVAKDLAPSAIVNIKPPGDIDAVQWATAMGGIAKRRPYLWRNHRNAVDSGYLEVGQSAVVSFPTGAGKSTLSELKIATMLLHGKKVVFLAPTLALVDQTAKALRQTFPGSAVQRERGDTLVFEDFIGDLPDISVMTTERCLALLGYDNEAFSEVGLLVFDECHLLHSGDSEPNRRAIDAMLCVLNFVHLAPEADLLLLSAMMKNTPEIADWVSSMTGRVCLSLALTWKPTRQVRGCVVYDAAQIEALNEQLRATRLTATTVGVPSAVKRGLTAQPMGLFCLNQTWNSQNRADYSLLPILEDQVTLATGTTKRGDWYLTPNGNKVAGAIAAATAKQGLKTLVFAQTIVFANSVTTTVNLTSQAIEIHLTSVEEALLNETIEELGDISHSYITKTTRDSIEASCVCHHGLLLPSERHLHEALFKRSDGVNVMVATSTLAQGMNLPSEVVIIGGDSRFDPDANRVEQLEAHELLNAAGRAGRAGDSSYGFVLVVPSKVVHFSDVKNEIHTHWSDLQAIFSQSDQCVTIDDPLTVLLDQLQLGHDPQPNMVKYLISRLPVGENADKDGLARSLLLKSFAAYRAKMANNQAWIDRCISATLAARKVDGAPANPTWAERLAAATGVDIEIILWLGGPMAKAELPIFASTVQLREWLLDALKTIPHFVPSLIRSATLEGLFGKPYRELETDAERGSYALDRLSQPLALWMEGATLAEIEVCMGTDEGKLGRCDLAREFVLRVVPELAFVFGLPLQVIRALKKGTSDEQQLPGLSLATLGTCVREGFNMPEKLALRLLDKKSMSRVATHRQFDDITAALSPAIGVEDLAMAMARVRKAKLASSSE